MPLAADQREQVHAEASDPPILIGRIFHDLQRPGAPIQSPLPISPSRGLPGGLAASWPELRFQTAQGALRAAPSGNIPSRAAGLVFQTALLRAPSARAGAWASSTIASSWRDGSRHPGLGERLLARSEPAPAMARGAAVASAIVAERLGGHAGALPPEATRALNGGSALIASDDTRQDTATLRHLLQTQSAAKLTVLVDQSNGPLARLARRAGATVLPRAAAGAWAVAEMAGAIHAPLHDDVAVIARLAGRPVFTHGIRAADCPPGLLAAAYLLLASRYRDPADGRAIPCEAFLDRLIEWRRLAQRVPPIACFAGISFWKRPRMAEFAGGARFARTASQAVAIAGQERAKTGRGDAGIAVWPSRAPAHLAAAAAAAGIPLFQVEDGFIRSRGLGADFIPPASVIIDRRGIYYDASQLSDLEALLSGAAFPPELLGRARRLMDSLVTRRITKYNLGGAAPAIAFPAGRRRILVPGQVANDLSVRTGGAGIAPGLALLAEVRRRNPGAFIVYKPHPDVEAGHRPGAVPDADLRQLADLVVRDVEMGSLIEAVDAVHTLTSLTGFEALLRQRPVTTYGWPFYAGWGLTTDINPPPRRGRPLSLEHLVAATLILYPHYLDPVTRLPCGPEALIERLDQTADWRTGLLVGLRRRQGALRRTLARRLSLARRVLSAP